MINSADWSGPGLIQPTTGRPPSASGQTGKSAIAEPAAAGLPHSGIISLPAIPSQVAEARRFVASFLADPALAADAMLCLSEVAANAVIHSDSRCPGGRFTVGVKRYSEGHIRIEVHDEGGRWIERAKPKGQRHLGLTIVGRLASAWGIEGDGFRHRTVWFELRPAAAAEDSLRNDMSATLTIAA
jgi:anti-sigma regulatory factor (Ser/Thr protein kinase)